MSDAPDTPGESQPPPPKPRRRRKQLETLEDVRRCLARACRSLEKGTLEPKQGNALIYGLSTLAKLISASEFETRLRAVEERMTREAVQ